MRRGNLGKGFLAQNHSTYLLDFFFSPDKEKIKKTYKASLASKYFDWTVGVVNESIKIILELFVILGIITVSSSHE